MNTQQEPEDHTENIKQHSSHRIKKIFSIRTKFFSSKLSSAITITFLVFVALLISITFDLLSNNNNSSEELNTYNPVTTETNRANHSPKLSPTPNDQDDSGKRIQLENTTFRTYPSLNRQYTLIVYLIKNTDTECQYMVRTSLGYTLPTDSLPLKTIPCNYISGPLDTNVIDWIEENKFVIKTRNETLLIVDPLNNTIKTHTFNANDLEFIAVNRSFNYFLYIKKDTDSYVLMNQANQVVLDNITFDDYDVRALYDTANDGFVFIGNSNLDDLTVTRIDYLSLDDILLRKLLQTEPITSIGKGCTPNYLVSKPGEIIIVPSCFTLSEKYKAPDGNLHLPL